MAHHTFVDYMGLHMPGLIVPQQAYVAGSIDFRPRSPVRFGDNGMVGIRLKRALDQDFRGMPDAAQQITLNENGTKIAVRVLWPGYPAWYQHVHAYDHTNMRNPITKSKLAYDVARLVRLFFDDMSSAQSSEPLPDWWVNNMRYEDLILLEMRNVSAGSWQPVLCRAFQ